jgi:hypothetical protein
MAICTAHSSSGHFEFDSDTGKVGYCLLDNWNDCDYPAIVDVEEYQIHYGQPVPKDIDILDIGYWTNNCFYEEPAHDWRIETAELRKSCIVLP